MGDYNVFTKAENPRSCKREPGAHKKMSQVYIKLVTNNAKLEIAIYTP